MDDNTFECPNCGARIYPELTRCPHCGQNMYPEDEEDQPAAAESSQASWVASLGGMLIGWMIACGIALLMHFIVASFVTPVSLGGFGSTLLILAGPLGVGVGSYVAAGIAHRQHLWLGALVGALAIPALVLFATHWVEVNSRWLSSPWIIVVALLTILTGVLGGWLNRTFTQGSDWKEKWRVRGWEDLLYQDLLRKVRFNGSAADRLIEYERKQDPQATRLKLIQNAIERWERDNR